MLASIFKSKYTSWTLSSFFIITIILNETIDLSYCWIILAIELLCIFSFGYYFIDSYKIKFKTKLHLYSMAIFLIVGILFGEALFKCQLG
jgi:hypothetical protein